MVAFSRQEAGDLIEILSSQLHTGYISHNHENMVLRNEGSHSAG